MKCVCALLVVVACAFTVAGQEPRTKSARKGQDTPPPDRTEVYKRLEQRELKLFIFEPVKTDKGQPRTAIVFFFGGGWKGGTPTQFSWHCRHLAELGMTSIAADYRVHSLDSALVTDCVADAQDALFYVRSQAGRLGIDPNRIAAGGGSAGGHLAAATATLTYRGTNHLVRPELFRPNALVLFNPAVVLAPIEGRPIEAKPSEELLARMGDQPQSLSPFHHLTKSQPPTLVLHGRADTAVPYWTVEAFRDRAIELGCRCELVGYDRMPHGFFNHGRDRYTETRDEMVRFLKTLSFLP